MFEALVIIAVVLAIIVVVVLILAATKPAEFTMLPHGGATNILWVMHGPAPFMSKVMQMFMNMDRMIGKDFETGLANLKTISEK